MLNVIGNIIALVVLILREIIDNKDERKINDDKFLELAGTAIVKMRIKVAMEAARARELEEQIESDLK